MYMRFCDCLNFKEINIYFGRMLSYINGKFKLGDRDEEKFGI